MVTIIAVQSSAVIVVYTRAFYKLFFHDGKAWRPVSFSAFNRQISLERTKMACNNYLQYLKICFNCQTCLDDDDAEVFSYQGPGQSKQESGNTNNSGNHGVINYNFYNQQWQNSVDLEHAMEQNNTAYGGTGGGDSSHTSNRGPENLLLSGLNAAATILPLLADGLTEDFENSDRVSKDQSGASTIITQHQVGCLTYPKPNLRIPVSSAADEKTEAGPSVRRYITINIGAWTSTNAVYSGWYVPLPYGILQSNTPFGALARRHYLVNCGYKVQVQLNSTRFHGGALGVFMVPQFVVDNQNSLKPGTFSGQSAVSQFNLQSLFLAPHQILNPRTNSSAMIEVPYAHCFPACNPVESAPWTLVVMVLETLSYSTGATTSLEIVASITPTDAEFHGIRQTNAEFEGPPKVQLSSNSTLFCTTQPHSSEPVYGAMVRSSPRYLPAEIIDFLQISSIPTLTRARAVTFQQTIPTNALLQMNVSLSATDLLNTSIETVSRGFAQYRGSIVIRMVFVGNQMQNVRFVGSYTPPGADPPTTVQQAMDGIYTIYDTGLNSAANFVIPFISSSDFRYCNTNLNYDAGSGGYFTIWQLTNLAVPPGSPATASMLVFAATGADFEWRCVTTPFLQLQGDGPVSAGETGQAPLSTAEDTNEKPVPIPYTESRLSQSAVRFWFDRFFIVDSLNVPNNTNTVQWTINIERLNPEIRWFTHATYFRFELEIQLNTYANNTGRMCWVAFYPPGSVIPAGTITWGGAQLPLAFRRNGAAPVWKWSPDTSPVFTTRLPFVSPASTFANTYTGWRAWDHTNFGAPPGTNVLGVLVLSANSAMNVEVGVRMVDIQMFCPRPGQYLTPPTPTAHEGATNYELLALAGDVELNPGPFFMKVARKLEPDLDAMFKKFEKMQETYKKLTDFSEWFKIFQDADKKKWLKRFVKFLSYGVILTRAKHDPMLAAAAAFLLSGDWLTNLCCKIVKWLKEHCRTAPPELPCSDDPEDKPDEGTSKKASENLKAMKAKFEKQPSVVDLTQEKPEAKTMEQLFTSNMQYLDDLAKQQCDKFNKMLHGNGSKFRVACDDSYPEGLNPFDETLAEKLGAKFKSFFKLEGPISELNSVLVLCRNAHWLGQQIQKVLDWLGLWKQQEENVSEERFKEEMRFYPNFMKTYEAVKNAPRHKDWKTCQEWFDKMREMVMHHDPKLVTLFPNMTVPCHENTRQEPILVVLRGLPGQGKSVAASMLAQMFAHSLTGKPDYYSYNSSTNFFDGYRQQPVVLIDDLGQNPDGTDFSVFCQMISTTPFHPNMADLKDKGIKFDSPIIIATTNLSDFRPNTISDPAALKRRINFDFEVEAGPAYRTRSSTLDLERALTPTGCASTLPCIKREIALMTSAALRFKDRRGRTTCECSMVDVYNRVMNAHRQRGDILTRLQDVFSFEGPKPHDPRSYSETYPVPMPRKRDVQRWCDMAVTEDPRDDAVFHFLRQNCDNVIFGAYVRRFYGGGPDPTRNGSRLDKVLKMMAIVTQVLAFLLMVCSFGVVIWTLFTSEGPYSGNAVKRPKPKGLKVIDIAQLEGPMNLDLEKSLISKNVVQLKCTEQNGSSFVTGALAIRGRVLAMNYHLWKRSVKIQFDGEAVERDVIPAVRPAVNGSETELVFLNFSRTPGRQYRDITSYFPQEQHLKLGPAAKVTGLCGHMDPSFMFMAESLGTYHSARTWDGSVPMVLKYRAQTAPGFCGSVIVVDNGIWKKVFGIHCAGAHGVGLAAIITQEMLKPILALGEFQGKIHDVKPHAYIYTPHKTAFFPTVACDNETTVEPAALSQNDPRLEKPLEFKKSILAKHVGDRTDGPIAMIQAARHYARRIRAMCGPVHERLSLREAVFGTDNLDPMDMTRSPGWPYIGSQRRPDLLKLTDEGELLLDPVLRAELMNFMEGNYQHHKFVTFMKDELRDKEKVMQGKTRVIDIASFGHAIMGRVLFGQLAAAMHAKNGVPLGSAVGTNPDIDWTRYANEFRFKNFVDIDYSGFDATHSSFSFFCLKVFLKELGFDDNALLYVDSLCESTHIWDDEEFQITGGLPSGCSCTSIFNTIMNNIVVRGLVPEVYEGAFDLLAYGDDLVLNTEWKFDVDEYKKLLEEVTNYKITPASKTGTFEWTNLEGVVFLKRHWYRDGLLYRPIMTYKNLHNILSYARAGTVNEKIQSVARLAQHRGRDDYKSLFQAFEDCGFETPSFDALELEFFSLFFG